MNGVIKLRLGRTILGRPQSWSAALRSSARTVRTMHVAARPSDLVGNTPLLDLSSLLEDSGASGSKLYGKLESLGPCSSVKDRIGKYMIDDAEAQGLITPGKTTLVEPTR
jgi:threonine synthase